MGLFNFKSKQDKTESVNADENAKKLYASSRSFQSVGTKYKNGRYVSADELYEYIVIFLSKSMESYGFKYLKSKKTFKRTTETGCDEIHIHSNDHVHYHFDFHFRKRIDSIQKVITAFEFENGYNSISNYREHSTIWVCYSNIMKNKIEVVSYSVLEKELIKLGSFIEREIIPQFDRLNSLEVLNQVFNYPEKDPTNHFSYFSLLNWNCHDGLVVAKICNDSNYEYLLKKYSEAEPDNLILKEHLRKLDEYLKRNE